jgi:adenosine deaminase
MEGAVRFSTLMELLPASERKSGNLEADTKAYFCCDKKVASLTECLEKFVALQRLFTSVDIVERVAFEVVVDQAADGVVLFEMRYSPRFIQLGKSSDQLSVDDIHAAVVRGVRRAQQSLGAGVIEVGLICILDRFNSDAESAEVVDFVLKHRNDFVGVDLANDESKFNNLFVHEFDRARAAGLGVTIHAGEVGDDNAPKRVLEAIDKQGATRIGHGLHVLKDPAVVAICRQRNIHFEVSVSSNVITNAIGPVTDHPLAQMIADLGSVGLNTDDPGLFCVDLAHEVRLVKDVLGITDKQLQEMQLAACRASFLPADVKQRVEQQLAASFQATQ